MAAIAEGTAGSPWFPSAAKVPQIRFPENVRRMPKRPMGEDVTGGPVRRVARSHLRGMTSCSGATMSGQFLRWTCLCSGMLAAALCAAPAGADDDWLPASIVPEDVTASESSESAESAGSSAADQMSDMEYNRASLSRSSSSMVRQKADVRTTAGTCRYRRAGKEAGREEH